MLKRSSVRNTSRSSWIPRLCAFLRLIVPIFVSTLLEMVEILRCDRQHDDNMEGHVSECEFFASVSPHHLCCSFMDQTVSLSCECTSLFGLISDVNPLLLIQVCYSLKLNVPNLEVICVAVRLVAPVLHQKLSSTSSKSATIHPSLGDEKLRDQVTGTVADPLSRECSAQ